MSWLATDRLYRDMVIAAIVIFVVGGGVGALAFWWFGT